MAKLYKVRKRCLICGNVFYPRYAGSLYCEDCKNRKKEDVKKKEAVVKKAVAKVKKVKKSAKRPVKKIARKTAKKSSKKKR